MSSDSSTGALGTVSRWLMPAEDIANFLAAIAILLLMFLGVAQIVLRTVFNSPIAGYIDLVQLSMASMAFLGAAYCQRLGAHIRMELIIGQLKGRAYWMSEIIATLVALFIIGVLIWYTAQHFWRAFTLGDTTIDAEYQVWPSKLLVPVAFSIWFLRLLIQFWGSVRMFLDPSKTPVAVVTIKHVAEQAQDEIHDIMGDIETDDDANTGGTRT